MSLFTDLVAEVYDLTKRPDLVAETELAVKNATLKLHQRDFYYKDLAETGIQFLSSEYQQELDYRTIFPRWRSVKYLRKYDAPNDTPSTFLDLITPEEVLDAYHLQKENVYYASGNFLKIRSNTEEQYYLLGYYNNPIILPATYDSWIALDHRYAVVCEAAAFVFKTIGYDEQAQMYKVMLRDEYYPAIDRSNIGAIGY